VRTFFLAAALLTLAGCSTIESKTYLAQPANRSLQASVGGVVVHVDRKRDLENVFGKADLYGRKTYEGFSELRFMGVQDGQVALRRVDVVVLNDETTMSRGGFMPTSSTSQTTGTFGNVPFSATTNKWGSTYIPPRPGNVSVSTPSVIDFLVPIGQPLPFEGYTVTFSGADSVRVSYTVQ
jgi:hypothetical protein